MVWPAFPQCLEGYSRETGSVVNKIQCRIREYVDGTRNVTSAWEVRYAEIWPRMRVWKKKGDIRNSDEKSLGCAFRTLLSRPYKLTSVLSVLCPTFCSILLWPVFSSESVSNCIRTAKWVKWLQLHSVLESFNHLTWHPCRDQPTGLHEE